MGLCVAFLKVDLFKHLFRIELGEQYFMTAFFALFIFTGILNSFNARTPRVNLFANLGGNRAFVVIMAAVAGVQLLLIYFGGSLFRVAGLTLRELATVLLISTLVLPVDLLRKTALRKKGITPDI